MPVLPAGVNCQNSGGTHVIGGAGQQAICMEDMDAYIQDVLDLIEWAKGPADSKWLCKGCGRKGSAIQSRVYRNRK